MKAKLILFTTLALSIFSSANAQINLGLGTKAMGALQKGVTSLMFSDADAAQLAKDAVRKLDSTNVVAGATDPYTVRLNKIFAKHKMENGIALNYKVYKTKDINAFACADGSVRVYAGLMDIMDDNELLAVIGHEIGHVINHDTKDAIKAAYRKEALLEGAASQSEKIASISDSQLVKIGSALIDCKYSRKQESEADDYSYDFMKRNGYNVNAVEAAFNTLVATNGGANVDLISKMMSTHPDPKDRADKAKAKAMADGVYAVYVKKTAKATKPAAKKVVAKKKK